MTISHSQSIATKGLLSGDATTLASKGYIHIRIEEIPIPVPKKRGRGAAKLGASVLKKEEQPEKKIIKVTVTFKGVEYIEAKVVPIGKKVTTKDVDVKLGKEVKIEINIDGVRLDKKDIENLN